MSLETKEYAKRLVEQMTLEEKISQMRYESPAIERLHIPAYNWWNEALHGVARSGVATMFPHKEMGNTKNRKTIVLSIKGGILNVN